MDILVLGGTRYFGRHLVEDLLQKGHAVTLGTRGRTPDGFGGKVNRLVLDRTDGASLKKTLSGREYDVVYDNINYSPTDTENLLSVLKAKRYILTSSAAVYKCGLDIEEGRFDPFSYPVKRGEASQFSYGEGKRLCESMMFRQFDLPSVAVRFPVVLGPDDYTRRLLFYVERVVKGLPFYADNLEAEWSFVYSTEAGGCLAELAESAFTGSLNIASQGSVSLREIVAMIERLSGREARLEPDAETAPYNGMGDYVLNTARARSLGLPMKELSAYLGRLLACDADAVEG